MGFQVIYFVVGPLLDTLGHEEGCPLSLYFFYHLGLEPFVIAIREIWNVSGSLMQDINTYIKIGLFTDMPS